MYTVDMGGARGRSCSGRRCFFEALKDSLGVHKPWYGEAFRSRMRYRTLSNATERMEATASLTWGHNNRALAPM